ncbi:N-acetylglucosaminyl-phosphatidylinositol de-N-acetylase [Tulasnella sp. 427]|nr:N-acetylglucosaminyl-phosphatidylinositol de-N-acetylase [Tulasnella sp. 427]
MLLTFLFIPLVLSFLLTPQNTTFPPYPDNVTGNPKVKALLVTAHPDDECMFFGPTILGLRQQNAEVYGLVLSNGGSEGLGKERELELKESYAALGVDRDKVTVLDHPQLQDDITRHWRKDLIAGIVHDYVQRLGITDIITFDRFGVSKHPNHISTCEGVILFFANFALPPPSDSSSSSPTLVQPPRAWALRTVSLLPKYTGFVSTISLRIILAVENFQRLVLRVLGRDETALPSIRTGDTIKTAPLLTFLSTPAQYVATLNAMRKHKTQLVWFRWLYVTWSRYMWINELQELKVPV